LFGRAVSRTTNGGCFDTESTRSSAEAVSDKFPSRADPNDSIRRDVLSKSRHAPCDVSRSDATMWISAGGLRSLSSAYKLSASG
jgi:hypothetical protein